MTIPLILIVLAVLAALALFALLLAGYWETPEQLKHQLMDYVGGRSANPPVAFRAWVASRLNDNPELQGWLLALPEEGFKALTERVIAFCADLNIQLSWLVEGHVDVAPDLRQATKTIVVNYLEVCREAIGHQAEIAVFRSYRQAIANPADSRYRDLRRRLFTRLVADGMAEPLPSYQLIMASEIQRQALAADAIRDAAAKDWLAFTKVFQSVVIDAAASESPERRAA